MKFLRSPLGLALALLLLAAACARGSGSEDAADGAAPPQEDAFPVTLTDDDGVEVTLEAPPQRIVTFAPSLTEIVFALGVGDRLVGVSGDYDNYPEEATKVEQIGGAGDFGVDPNIEKLVSLEPDLFLAISGGEQWKDRLEELDIPVFTSNATDFEDLLGDIEAVGRLTGAGDEARGLTADMREQAGEIEARVSGEQPATPCFFEVYFPPLTTVGPNTFIYDLLERAGCAPVTSSAESDYPEWSVEQLVEEGPEVYLVSSESGASVSAVAKRPGFGAIDAVKEGRVELIDADLIGRPGPRVTEGLRLLAEALHPDAA